MTISRRSFLGTTAAAAAVASGAATRSAALGANEKVGVCCVGVHGQGRNHIAEFTKYEASEVVALCDVDRKVLEERGAQLAEKTGKKPKLYADMREAFEDKSIDAVSIATPNHWHTLATIWACQAGKDVYVEKPLAHSFWEGQQLVKAAEKYQRIVQHGTQQRSDPTCRRDMKLLHEGTLIGPVVHARGYVYKNGNRMAIGRGKAGTPPEHLDYNLWLGPAGERPWMDRVGGDPNLDEGGGLFVPYNWHWFWDFGNGECGNQGVHEMDVAVWAANKGLPVRVASNGGRYAWKDDGQTPNTQASQFTYADGTLLTFEVRNLGSFNEACNSNCSNSAFGTDGYWVREKGFFDYQNKPIPIPESAALPHSDGPFGNFINAVKSRKLEDVHGTPEEGFKSCAHIHLANIAYRLQQSLNFDPAKGEFAQGEKANGMLKDSYREPFVVPEIV